MLINMLLPLFLCCSERFTILYISYTKADCVKQVES